MTEKITSDGEDLLGVRRAFLSRRVAKTCGAYAEDQLARVEARRRRTGKTNHKQAMHMIRLLMAGAHVLRTGEVLVDVRPHRDRPLAVKHGDLPWPEVAAWAATLQRDLALAETETRLPDHPDLATIDQLLHRVRERGWDSDHRRAGVGRRDRPSGDRMSRPRAAVAGDHTAILALAVDFYAEDGFRTPREKLDRPLRPGPTWPPRVDR